MRAGMLPFPQASAPTGGSVRFDAASGRFVSLNEFADALFRLTGSADKTKRVAFEVDGLTSNTVRTLTVPDASGTLTLLELAQTFTATQRMDATEALTLGGAATAGNGRLQLASHTTKAGGIAFGTDVFLHRATANLLRLTAGFEVNSDRAYGAGVRMYDLGTSSKYFRCDAGNFQILNDAFSTVLLSIADDGTHTIGNGTSNVHNLATATATTVGAAGAASALPANPTGYIRIAVNGTIRKIPYYAD